MEDRDAQLERRPHGAARTVAQLHVAAAQADDVAAEAERIAEVAETAAAARRAAEVAEAERAADEAEAAAARATEVAEAQRVFEDLLRRRTHIAEEVRHRAILKKNVWACLATPRRMRVTLALIPDLPNGMLG